jgi:hypothetical protein
MIRIGDCRVVFGGANSDVFEGLVSVNHGFIESSEEGVELYKAGLTAASRQFPPHKKTHHENITIVAVGG